LNFEGLDFGKEDCSSGGFQFKLTQITSKKPGQEEVSHVVNEGPSALE
jgi:hypothetical protein